jgi:hypothetical protein
MLSRQKIYWAAQYDLSKTGLPGLRILLSKPFYQSSDYDTRASSSIKPARITDDFYLPRRHTEE